MLSDIEILGSIAAGEIIIEPFEEENLGPNSYDLTLNKSIKVAQFGVGSFDLIGQNIMAYTKFELPYILGSWGVVTFMTNEVVGCKEKTMGIISQRSNLARLPVVVNFSALLDTGFVGRLSGAIINPNNFPIVLKPNIRILQIMFDSCIGINRKYAGRKSSKNLDQFGSDVPVYKVDKEWIKHD